jgi:hypothetical protein
LGIKPLSTICGFTPDKGNNTTNYRPALLVFKRGFLNMLALEKLSIYKPNPQMLLVIMAFETQILSVRDANE